MSLQYLSLGGGVQSTALFLMSVAGLFPRPEVVVFADTGVESEETYRTVKLCKNLAKEHEIPFAVVKNKWNQTLIERYTELNDIPYVRNPQCTFHFKVYPIRRHVKTLVDKSLPKPWATSWLGITTDEAHRMRDCELQWTDNRYPLIELGMSRQDCVEYIEKEWPKFKVSKSGCVCCPYMSRKNYEVMKLQKPDIFKMVLEFENNARINGTLKPHQGLMGGKSLELINHTHTLADFGFDLPTELNHPEAFECSSVEGGCFL